MTHTGWLRPVGLGRVTGHPPAPAVVQPPSPVVLCPTSDLGAVTYLPRASVSSAVGGDGEAVMIWGLIIARQVMMGRW